MRRLVYLDFILERLAGGPMGDVCGPHGRSPAICLSRQLLATMEASVTEEYRRRDRRHDLRVPAPYRAPSGASDKGTYGAAGMCNLDFPN